MKRRGQHMKDLGLVFKGKERRSGKRHVVRWQAILDVQFPDFRDQIEVTIVNFSAGGALLHSKQLAVDNQHLVITETRPELTLKISLSETVLELTTAITWYNVSNESGTFEIGVSFTNFNDESDISVDDLVKIMGEMT